VTSIAGRTHATSLPAPSVWITASTYTATVALCSLRHSFAPMRLRAYLGSRIGAHSSLAGSKRVSRVAIASIPARIGSSGASASSRTVVPMEGKTSSFMRSPW
jgi:hypothetical protein